MSFSFSKRAGTKAAAKVAVAAGMDEVLTQQPAHSRDRAAVEATAAAYIDLLDDDESKDIVVTVNGSIGGEWANGAYVTSTSASVGLQAYLAVKVDAS